MSLVLRVPRHEPGIDGYLVGLVVLDDDGHSLIELEAESLAAVVPVGAVRSRVGVASFAREALRPDEIVCIDGSRCLGNSPTSPGLSASSAKPIGGLTLFSSVRVSWQKYIERRSLRRHRNSTSWQNLFSGPIAEEKGPRSAVGPERLHRRFPFSRTDQAIVRMIHRC